MLGKQFKFFYITHRNIPNALIFVTDRDPLCFILIFLNFNSNALTNHKFVFMVLPQNVVNLNTANINQSSR